MYDSKISVKDRMVINRFSPFIMFIFVFSIYQIYYNILPLLNFAEDYAAYLLFYAALGCLLYFIARVGESSNLSEFGFILFGNLKRTLLLSFTLAVIYFIVINEPGLVYGFAVKALISPLFFLFASPIVAIGEEGIFRGYIFRKISLMTNLNTSLIISSSLYSLCITNFTYLFGVNTDEAVRYIFLNTFTGFALAILMGIFYFKSNWSLAGPISLRALLILQSFVLPISSKVPSWEFSFVMQLIGYVILLIIIETFMKERKHQMRKYAGYVETKVGRFLRKTKAKQDLRRAVARLAVGILIISAAISSLELSSAPSLHPLAVASGSMQPALYRGDLIIVAPIQNGSQLQKGDVVAYHSSLLNAIVVHRIVQIMHYSNGSVMFITKGDNNPVPDPLPISQNEIVGKVVLSIAGLGYFVLSPLLAIILIIILLLFSILVSLINSNRKKRWSVMI